MDAKGIFSGLEPYKLTSIRVMDRELGHSSYATILELEYMGLKCAGKKIHKNLQSGEDSLSYAFDRFETECHLLSQICHPNIVQFMGVYTLNKKSRYPSLLWSFFPLISPAELEELRRKIALYEAQIEKVKQETDLSGAQVQLAEEDEMIDTPEAQENGESAARLSLMFTRKFQSLRSEVSRTRTKADALQHRLEADIAIRDGDIRRNNGD